MFSELEAALNASNTVTEEKPNKKKYKKNYNKEEFIETVKDLCANPEKLSSFSKSASEMAVFDTADRIYNEVRALVK